MKLIQRIFIFAVIGIVVLSVGLAIFVAVQGKPLIEAQLKNVAGPDAKLEGVSYLFPMGVKITGLELDAQNVIKEIAVQLTGFSKDQITVGSVSVNDVSVKVVKAPDKKIMIGGFVIMDPAQTPSTAAETPDVPAGQAPSTAQKPEQAPLPITIVVNKVNMDNGRFMFQDQSSPNGIVVGLKDVNVSAKNIVFPLKDQATSYELTATLDQAPPPFAGNQVKSQGTVNVVKRDMQATVSVLGAGGKEGLGVSLDSKNNDMLVKGNFQSTNLVGGTPGGSSMNDLLGEVFRSSGIEFGGNFSFQTRMDDFQLHKISFSGNLTPTSNGDSSGKKLDWQGLGEKFGILK